MPRKGYKLELYLRYKVSNKNKVWPLLDVKCGIDPGIR